LGGGNSFLHSLRDSALEISLHKRTNLIPGHVFERKLAHCVVAAWKNGDRVIPLFFSRALDHLPRKVNGKCCVETRVNEFRSLLLFRVEIVIAGRTNAKPELAQSVEVNRAFKALPYVPGRQPFPNHVRDIGGTVVEHVHFDSVIVGTGEK